MPDLRGLLAALGGGAESLGSDIGLRDQQAVLRRRQAAEDALNRLMTLQKIGGQDVPDGTDPTQMAQNRNDYNDMVSGVGTAIPNSAVVPEGAGPSQYGKVRSIKLPDASGQLRDVVIDPSRTPEALAEQRMEKQQAAITARQQGIETAKEQAKTVAGVNTARANYNTLKAMVKPDSPFYSLTQQDFDPNNAANYDRAVQLEGQRQLLSQKQDAAPPRNIDPLSDPGIAAAVKRAALIAAQKPKVQTPDQVHMQTVSELAGPAADILTAYYEKGGAQGFAPFASGVASHIPLVGNRLANLTSGEQDYQNAHTAAETLATQYLEAMPKSRFQPSSLAEIMKQIAPTSGDNPAQRAQKAARVRTLKAAIAKRAANPTDLADPTSLDDAPVPPGVP